MNLKKHEREYVEYLRNLMENMNAPKNFIDNTGGINPELFKKSLGGIYEDDDVNDDIKYTNIEANESYQKEQKEMRDGSLSERIIPLIFNKILKGSDYVVIKTSLHDDFRNGVDEVIMNVKTGEVICAVDDFVHNSDVYKDHAKNERRHDYISKVERFINKKKDGMDLKYSAIFKNKQFIKLTPLSKLPFTVFKTERKHFYKAMKDMDFSIESDIGESEKVLAKQMLQSMEEQIPIFSEKVNVSYDSVEKFVQFLKEKII